jgi:hypothetical protein
MKRFAIVLLLLLSPTAALACGFDTDCEVGSRCVKASGSLYGVCVGGLSPGNAHDQQPVYAPLDLNGTYGDTCSFDLDCGINAKCVKPGGGLYGTCISK